MAVFIALLRGINVGGHNKLPMKMLREIVEAQGGENVSTYIQSGNAVFTTRKAPPRSFAAKLGAAIETKAGFKPDTFVIEEKAFKAVLKNNPYAACSDDPSKLLVAFLPARADPKKLQGVKELLQGDEKIAARGAAIYFHAPQGIARSKAAEKLARAFTGGTVRNWRTCLKLDEMINALI